MIAAVYAFVGTILSIESIGRFFSAPNMYAGSMLAAKLVPVALGLLIAVVCFRGTSRR